MIPLFVQFGIGSQKRWLKRTIGARTFWAKSTKCCCLKGCCKGQITFPPTVGPDFNPSGTTILKATMTQIINKADCLHDACEGEVAIGVPVAGGWTFCLCTDINGGECLDPFRVACVTHPQTGLDTLLLQFDNTLTCPGTPQCPDNDTDWYPISESCNPVKFEFRIVFSEDGVLNCAQYGPEQNATELLITIEIDHVTP